MLERRWQAQGLTERRERLVDGDTRTSRRDLE
jgi:hypothetical protein